MFVCIYAWKRFGVLYMMFMFIKHVRRGQSYKKLFEFKDCGNLCNSNKGIVKMGLKYTFDFHILFLLWRNRWEAF